MIESFLLNLPIPPVYLAEEDGGKFAVIDGRQRLTAIQTYFSDELTLTGLETFEELEGTSFSQLPFELKSNLRHTAATLPIAQGQHARVVIEMLGQAQIPATVNVYRHLMDPQTRDAADAVDEALRGEGAAEKE